MIFREEFQTVMNEDLPRDLWIVWESENIINGDFQNSVFCNHTMKVIFGTPCVLKGENVVAFGESEMKLELSLRARDNSY